MATTLAAQLQKLAAATSAQTPYIRGKPSILFTYQEAADIDLESIYHLGLAGFNDLVKRDHRYQPFEASLFGRDVLAQHREHQTKEWNKSLSTVIASFLRLLSNDFLLSAAFKTLEYLIRKFKVNELEVDQVLECILPYHSTNEFVRVVQTLAIKNSRWEFLSNVQANGAAPPREVVVQRCITDKAFLSFICEAAQVSSKPDVLNRTMLSFYAVTLCEFLAQIPSVNEDTIALLLPFLLDGLKKDVFPDFRAASIMILSKLASRAPLSPALLTGLLDQVARSAEPRDSRMVALLLAHLAATQPHIPKLSTKFLKAIFKIPSFDHDLCSVAIAAPSTATPLLRLFTTSIASSLTHRPSLSAPLTHLVHHSPLAPVASDLASSLILLGVKVQANDGMGNDDKVRVTVPLLKVLRALEQRYPDQVDSAVNALLSQQQSHPKAAKSMESGGSDSEAEEDESRSKERSRVFEFVREAYQGTVHLPLEDGAVTLSMAMDAPAANVRRMAVEKMGELLSLPSLPQSSRAVAESALLRRLTDDDWGVVGAVLSVDGLTSLPPTALVNGLKDVLRRSEGALGSAAGDANGPATAVKLVMELLSTLLPLHPTLSPSILPSVLPYLLVTPSSSSISLLALQHAPSLPHPLFRHLTTPSQKPSKTPTKSSSKTPTSTPTPDPTSLNSATILSLSKALQSDPALPPALVEISSSTPPRGIHLLLLSLLHTCTSSSSPPSAVSACASAILSIVQSTWSNLSPSPSIPDDWESASAELILPSTCLPTPAHTKSLSKSPSSFLHTHQLVSLLALSSAINHIPLPSAKSELPPLFTSLASLHPTPAFLPILQHLLARLPPRDFLPFLVERCLSLPPADASSDQSPSSVTTAVAALHLATHLVTTTPLSVPTLLLTLLPALFPSLSSPSPIIRPAALSLLSSIADKLASLASDNPTTKSSKPQRGRKSGKRQDDSDMDLDQDEVSLPEGMPPAADVASFLQALLHHKDVIQTDSRALTHLMSPAPTVAPLPSSKTPSKSSKKQAQPQGSAPMVTDSLPSSLSLATEALESGKSLMLSLLPGLSGRTATPIALSLHSCLSRTVPPSTLLPATQPHLSRILSLTPSSLSAQDISLATAVLSLISPTTLPSAPGSAPLLISILPPPRQPTTSPASPEIRAAAFKALTPDVFTSLPPEFQDQALRALLAAAASDSTDTCREAAHTCLEAVPVNAAAILPLLTVSFVTSESETQEAQKRKRKKSLPATPAPSSPSVPFSLTTAVLELLQWKEPLPAASSLIPALQTLLTTLLPFTASITTPHTTKPTTASDSTSQGASASDPDSTVSSQPPPDGQLASYTVQLTLQALHRLVSAAAGSCPEVDLKLMVTCAQKAPDSAVRNAALTMVSLLAGLRPESTLEHVLEVMVLVNQSAATQDDTYSAKVAANALAAVVPAWLQGGRDALGLWQATISTLPSVPAHRRLALLSTLLSALPKESGLPLALLQLLELAAPSKSKKSPAKSPAKSALADPSEPQPPGPESWAPDLAASLAAQVPPAARLEAYASLMELSMANRSAHSPLPRTITAFVTTQLKVKSVLLAARQAGSTELDLLQEAGRQLMQQALVQLQGLNQSTVEKKGTKRAMQSAAQGLYDLVAALEGVLPSAVYIQALAKLVEQGTSDRLRYRTLRLYGSKVDGLQQEIADLDILSPANKATISASLSTASFALLPLASSLLSPSSSPTTRQSILLAIDSLSRCFGSSNPSPLVSLLPTLLTTCSDPSLPVQSSALTTIASIIHSAQHKVILHLPATVKTVLTCATESAQALALQKPPTDCDPKSDDDESGEEGSGSGSDDSDDEGKSSPSAGSITEQHAFKLAASLSAVDSMLDRLGPLLSPYVATICRMLIMPEVISCTSANCGTFAARVQKKVPEALPPRLLFDPLFTLLPDALSTGDPASVDALLSMVTEATAAMDSKVAAGYYDKIFAFLLRVLDVRQSRPEALAAVAGGLYKVECSAIKAVVALVMKLSEAKFKPLFLRLMEWANTAPVSGPDGAPAAAVSVGRMCTMMAVVEALTARLRSVFVPYYRYLLDICVQFLTSASLARPRSKKKRKQAVDVDSAVSAAASPADVEPAWVLKGKILRCLHRCFQSDSVGFLDQDRFSLLLPAVVDQLDAEVPEDVLAAFEVQCADSELDGAVVLKADMAVDVLGRAVVACLIQMAVTSASDALWKPLNQQVLMKTRSGSVRTRVLGLEVCAQLVDRLREEYLVLLPETIPFLAELMEDVDGVVQKRVQEVIKVLEEVSGEKLDQYLK